jgi:hypothetical protein
MRTKDSPGDSPDAVPRERTAQRERTANHRRPATGVAAVVLVTTILLGVIGSLAAGAGAQAGSHHGPLMAPQRWVIDRMHHTG